MMIVLTEFLKWCWANKKLTATLLAIGIILLLVLYQWQCGESRTDQRIEDRKADIIGVKAEVNGAAEEVKEAGTNVREAEKKLEAVKKKKDRNVSVDEANRNRCLAYPESCK